MHRHIAEKFNETNGAVSEAGLPRRAQVVGPEEDLRVRPADPGGFNSSHCNCAASSRQAMTGPIEPAHQGRSMARPRPDNGQRYRPALPLRAASLPEALETELVRSICARLSI